MLLESLKVAETQREIVLDAQVDLNNVWEALDRVSQVRTGSLLDNTISRVIGPAATPIFEAAKKP